MPEIGDEKAGERYAKLVWVACPECDHRRWVAKISTQRPGFTGRCSPCYRREARDGNRMYFPPNPSRKREVN